jgi:type II secretion system protein C
VLPDCLGSSAAFVHHLSPLVAGGIDDEQKTTNSNSRKGLIAKDSSQRLIGTAVSKDPADTFAVIEDVKNRQQWLYREGDTVGGILIKKILPGQIIIDRGRGEEVVKLRRSQITKAVGPLRFSGSAVILAIPNPERKNGPRDRHFLVDGEEVAAALADSQKLHQNVDMQSGKLFSRQEGVRINAMTVESIFPAMGLRKGDLLLGVNDQVITGPDDAVTMLQTMFEEGDEAELKVRRRARTYRIHLQNLQDR